MVQTNLIGKTILGYTVGEKLGSGAFGTVYKVIKTKQLQFLLDIIPVADNGNIEENMKAINTAISNINSLLRKRTELKRR